MEALQKVSELGQLELLNTTYVLLLTHIEKAMKNEENRKESVDLAKEILVNLMENLNFKVEISKDLFSLYLYVQQLLINSDRKEAALKEAYKIINILYEAFNEISFNENLLNQSKTAKVISGMTYGKGYLNHMIIEDENRGFEA